MDILLLSLSLGKFVSMDSFHVLQVNDRIVKRNLVIYLRSMRLDKRFFKSQRLKKIKTRSKVLIPGNGRFAHEIKKEIK